MNAARERVSKEGCQPPAMQGGASVCGRSAFLREDVPVRFDWQVYGMQN